MPPKSKNNWIEIKAIRRSALKRGGRPAAARHAEHIDRYRKMVKGLELAFNGRNKVTPSCGRLHRPNAIAESANSHRSVLVWPTDAPNKGAQRAPVAPTGCVLVSGL